MTNQQTLPEGHLLFHGAYKILAVLGSGGFGITYRALNIALDKEVAIKEFFPQDYCGRDSDTLSITITSPSVAEIIGKLKTKFIKEARKMAKLDHPGIVRTLTCFEENDTAYYVMDIVDGVNLAEYVKKNGPLPETTAARYIKQVAEALDYLHSKNLNHLDIKPDNIMLRTADNKALLIDFGLAKQYDNAGQQTSTTPTGISHGFAPLEQYVTGGVADFSPQTDIYALSATLFYLLSGQAPPRSL